MFKVRSEGTLEAEIAQLTEEQRRILMSTRPEALELAKDILR